MQLVKFPDVDKNSLRITCNKFTTGVKIKAAGELKIHDSPDKLHMCVHVCEFKTDPDAIEQKPSGRI